MRCSDRSIAIGRDDLTLRPRPERPPGLHVDRVLHELHRAVAEEDVDPAGVEARGRRVGPPREAAPRLVEPAAAPGVLLRSVTAWTPIARECANRPVLSGDHGSVVVP